jgi:hypothetical protein
MFAPKAGIGAFRRREQAGRPTITGQNPEPVLVFRENKRHRLLQDCASIKNGA